MSLGLSGDVWDCSINHFLAFWWTDLEELGITDYLSSLGWNNDSWDNDGPLPDTEDLYWDELTPEQQASASHLCYFRDLWDGIPIPEWEDTLM